MRFLFGFAILAILVGGVGASWVLGYFQTPGAQVTYTVQKGENFAGIAHKLKLQGVVRSARALRWYANFVPHKPLQRGEFLLSTGMPVPEVVKTLTEGKPIEYKFTVPEGENLYQIGEALESKGFATKADFLAAAQSSELIQLIPGLEGHANRPHSIEGYAYPDTYLLQKVFSAKEIAAIMVQHFREVYKDLGPDIQASPILPEFRFSPHQLVTLASIVEKETGNSDERPLVASIFVNRLRKRMRLQTDPTIIYGIYVAKGAWNGNISRHDLDERTAYNTYQIDGLPPGPIANPGRNALKAALYPANTDFLYFVSKGDGSHVFSKDYGAHTKAVKETQLKPHARDGKSWRNLEVQKRAK